MSNNIISIIDSSVRCGRRVGGWDKGRFSSQRPMTAIAWKLIF